MKTAAIPQAAQKALLATIVAGAIAASILGAHALQQAVIRARDLYQVDTAGSQMEGDLEFETQESRRAFLYALAVTDPNDQLPYVLEARAASQRVDEAVKQLRRLGVPEVTARLADFQRCWNQYDVARDEIIMQILMGNSPEALRVESERGRPSFSAALGRLHALKAVLEARARTDSSEVNATLRRSIGALIAFAVSILMILGLLVKSNRARLHALEYLRATHAALDQAREIARQRAAVLEMVSMHAALGPTLEKVVTLARLSHAEAGAAVWTGTARELHLQASANLPPEFTAALTASTTSNTGDAPAADLEQFRRCSSQLAADFGWGASPPKELREASGQRIGMLQMFAPAGRVVLWRVMLDQMAQLASVAIENSLLYERLAFQAQHDTLTGLANRLLFQDRVQQATRFALRHGKKVAVIWIDLDKYKQINDTLGHRVGDEVLCEVSRRLVSTLRQSDSVARVGGDEFTALVQDVMQPEDAELIAAKILSALVQPFQVSSREIPISASLGISIFPEHGEDPITLLRHADLAMYSAKRAGGGAFRMFRSALSDSMERRVTIERELKTALDNEELTLEYQPLLSRDGNLNGVEALVRWNNQVLGRVSPTEFIPIAEETDLIVAIGEWVTRTACQDGARWLREGYDVPRIAVNVSARQFSDGKFPALVQKILRECGLPASRLELEITETALIDKLELVIDQIEALRGLGLSFAIDDFGTGYSSLSHLANLPVDCVKIDRSFVKDLERGADGCTTLVRGIIALAHSLRLQVVAEGVETAEQLALLKMLGCDINQGFYLHRPMPAAALEELLGTLRREAIAVNDLPQAETNALVSI